MSSLSKHKGKAYWRSLAELADEPEFRKNLENEFPQSQLGESGSVSRRRFMQLMGASMALASGAGCRWEKENILPFTRRPAGMIAGIARHFATSMEVGGHAAGLLVTSHEGRPTKIEGNPQHPVSLGATDAFAQASVLEMYDPDRSYGIVRVEQGQESSQSWEEFLAYFKPVLQQERKTAGRTMRVLSEASASPTRERWRQRFATLYPQAKWVEYEPLSDDNARLGAVQAFGAPHRAHLQLEKAKVILALDADFLTTHPAALLYARAFAVGRTPQRGQMNRLYVVESQHSNTGAMADHRLPLRSETIKAFANAVMTEVLHAPGISAPEGASGYVAPALEADVLKFARAVAKDLVKNQGHGLVVVGSGQPPEVHALAHQLNALLQNNGKTVTYTVEADPTRPSHVDAIKTLATEMQAGNVTTLVIFGGNPAYNAPFELNFHDALAKVKNSIHLSLFRDETSRACQWHVNAAHYLESWGDARAYDGTISIIQPLIDPLYNGKSVLDLLAVMGAEEGTTAREMVSQTFAELAGGVDAGARWRQTVRDGFLAGSAWSTVTPTTRFSAATPVPASALMAHPANGALELTFWQDAHVYDGRFANNGWLQELPDFMSKVTWDNVAMFAPETAKELGIKHETLVTLQLNNRQLDVAAYIMPGQAQGSIAVSLGFGRTDAGHIGGSQTQDVASVGFNTYVLRPSQLHNFAAGLTVTDTGKFYELALTQDHHAMDAVAVKGRADRIGEIVREGTLTEFSEKPEFAREMVEHEPLESLWREPSYEEGHRWGMAIDLNACTGCNACVVACQAENNVPIVGKEQVIRGREMHWLRIDRYFNGDPTAPGVMLQPMTCQQCENAPCEQVCPVAATVHSHEGLNDMVYNRCIGTRYCSNNCPYKVRRFNFFNYHKNLADPANQVAKMVYNPEVTVRARGVMEKCTYCVQRIQAVKIVSKNDRRPILDGEIMPACAQACATSAITFGDLNNPESVVAKRHLDRRSYFVLEELNTKPRTAYLARIKNPNPELS